jgi:methanogenic corrinoid protein MtbC1
MSSTEENRFAAEILQSSCQSLAGFAAAALLEGKPEVATRFGPGAHTAWKSDVAHRIHELVAALQLSEPRIFVARVRWAKKAFEARNQNADDLLASLRALRDVLNDRLPEHARHQALNYIDQGLEALSSGAPPGGRQELNPSLPNDRLALNYLQRVLSGDVAGAIKEVLSAIEGGLPVTSAYVDVLIPAEREIGRLWHEAQVSAAEEHLVTGAIQRTMAVLAHNTRGGPQNGKTVLIAAISSNAHDIGLRAAGDLYQLAGWRVIFLGADVPEHDLPAMVAVFNADILLLGVTLAPQLSRAGKAIELVRKHSDRPVKIIVGGAAIDEAPEVWKTLGADGYAADLTAAEPLGARLAGLAP